MSASDNKENVLKLKREIQALKELKEKYSNVSLLETCYEHYILGMKRTAEILEIKLPEDGNPEGK